jgi:hypothetical protein
MVGLLRLLSLSYVSVYNSSRLSAVRMSMIPKKNLETFMVVSASIAVSVSSPQRNVDYVWFSSGVSCARTFIVSDLALYACVQGLESQGQESSGGRYVGLYVQLLPCRVCLVVGTRIWASKHSCIWFLAIFQLQFVPSFIRVYINSPWLIQGSSILDLLVQILLGSNGQQWLSLA